MISRRQPVVAIRISMPWEMALTYASWPTPPKTAVCLNRRIWP
jgi:hypothetical protein